MSDSSFPCCECGLLTERDPICAACTSEFAETVRELKSGLAVVHATVESAVTVDLSEGGYEGEADRMEVRFTVGRHLVGTVVGATPRDAYESAREFVASDLRERANDANAMADRLEFGDVKRARAALAGKLAAAGGV